MRGQGGHRYHKCFWGEFRSSSHRPDPRRPRRAVAAAAELPNSGSSSAELRGRPAQRLQTDPTGSQSPAPLPGAAGRLFARHAEDEPGAMLGEVRLRLVDPRLHGDGAFPAVQAALHRVSHADAQRALLAAKQRAAVSELRAAGRAALQRSVEPPPRGSCGPDLLRLLFLLRLTGPGRGLRFPRHASARGPAQPSVGLRGAASAGQRRGRTRRGLGAQQEGERASPTARPPEQALPKPGRCSPAPRRAEATKGRRCHPGDPRGHPVQLQPSVPTHGMWTRPERKGKEGGRLSHSSSDPTAGVRGSMGADKHSAARVGPGLYLLPARVGCSSVIPQLEGVPSSAPHRQNNSQSTSQGSAISSPLLSFIPYKAFAKAAPWSAG